MQPHEMGAARAAGSLATSAEGVAATLGPRSSPFGGITREQLVREVPIAEIDETDQSYRYRLDGGVPQSQAHLATGGQKRPVDLLAPAPYRILDGFRRVAALRSLGERTVMAIVHEVRTEEEAQQIAFVKNVVRKSLTPIERSRAILQARERGRTLHNIARDFGLSVKQVRRYMALADLPQDLADLVERGRVSMAHARVLAESQVDEFEWWADATERMRWSANRLAQEISKALGRGDGGPETYVETDDHRLRVSGFTISRRAPHKERERVLQLLREAIEFLEA